MKTRRSHRSGRTQAAKLRGLAAINRVRRGEAKSLTEAALAEGTTVKTIKALLPAAVRQERRGGRVRVRTGDPYSMPVEIITNEGILRVSARGSRQRKLAGRHHSIAVKVLKGELTPQALEQFRDQKVGGLILISDPDQLFTLVKGGELNQLDAVYVNPETRG